VANVDGSEARALTSDGAKKTNLRWTPDGQMLYYLSGRCIQKVELESGRVDNIACFEYIESLDAFEISPDGTRVAFSLNQQLYLIPYDPDQLSKVKYWSDIKAMSDCEALSPYASNTGTAYAVRGVRWSGDQQQISVELIGVDAGLQVDLIRILDVSRCVDPLPRSDEFPGTRFTISGYKENPRIPNFAWDGRFLFSLAAGTFRNGGFADLYTYNSDLHKGEKINPVEGYCCYRDPSFSPDGTYLAFAFQDIRQGADSVIKLYYIPFATLGTGLTYTPIALPEGLFPDVRESPQPALRPAR
jgi:Tol biopolymer transport system component